MAPEQEALYALHWNVPRSELSQHGEQPQDVLAGQPRIGELEPDDDGLPIQNWPATSRTYLTPLPALLAASLA
jgi:hypothetical protein